MDKYRDTSFYDNWLTLLSCAWTNICENPCSLELKLRVNGLFGHLYKNWDKLSIYNFLNWWIVINRNDFSDSNHTSMFYLDIRIKNICFQFMKLIYCIFTLNKSKIIKQVLHDYIFSLFIYYDYFLLILLLLHRI